jgi:drug/metabolite transporter (DMT)-like permease
MMRRTEPRAVLALVCVTAVWGSTFFLIKEIVDVIPPIDFLGVRFLIAGAVIAVVRARSLFRCPRPVWIRGAVLGLVYAGAQVLQTVGLQHTHASVSGFITGMYVVLTPVVLLAVFRVRVSRRGWAAILMATVGLMVLSLRGLDLGVGEAVTLAGSLLYAVHIVLLGHWAPRGHVLELGAIQVITVGVVCTLAALPGGVAAPQTAVQWAQMLYMALVAGLAAIVVQTWAQARMSPTAAAVVMTTEPLFAALFAVLLGGEHPTVRLIVGGSLIVGAMLVSETAPTTDSTATPPVTSLIKGDQS